MSSINSYLVGQVVRISDVVTVNGTDTDPSGVYTFQMIDPRGYGHLTEYVYNTDAAFERDAEGRYHVDWLIVHEGEHRYRFASGDGEAEGANEGMFRVKQSVFV